MKGEQKEPSITHQKEPSSFIKIPYNTTYEQIFWFFSFALECKVKNYFEVGRCFEEIIYNLIDIYSSNENIKKLLLLCIDCENNEIPDLLLEISILIMIEEKKKNKDFLLQEYNIDSTFISSVDVGEIQCDSNMDVEDSNSDDDTDTDNSNDTTEELQSSVLPLFVKFYQILKPIVSFFSNNKKYEDIDSKIEKIKSEHEENTRKMKLEFEETKTDIKKIKSNFKEIKEELDSLEISNGNNLTDIIKDIKIKKFK
jgi:hypothetical protein